MYGDGRQKIYNDTPINRNTILQILQDAWNIHEQNVADMKYLIRFFKGKQDILKRAKANNSEINNKVVLNYANSSVRNIVGYTFGKPIQFIPRIGDNKDQIKRLSDIFEYENAYTIDNEVAFDASITGLGYFCTLPSSEITSDFMPEIPIKLASLNAMNTFVIQSASIGEPVRLTCTYWVDNNAADKNIYTYFTAFTETEVYTIKSRANGSLAALTTDNEILEDVNVLGINPIQQVWNNKFLMGDFEVAISVLNALNQIASDSLNDVENVIKSLLVIINSELDKNTTEAVRRNRVLELLGSPRNTGRCKIYIPAA